jgi:P27 family predicted phage terminase small subunit
MPPKKKKRPASKKKRPATQAKAAASPAAPRSLADELRTDSPAPDWLSPRAVQLWPQVLLQLRQRDKLRDAPLQHVAMYCEMLARYLFAVAEISERGEIVLTERGEFAAPAVRIEKDSIDRLRGLAKDLGLYGPLDDPDDPLRRLGFQLEASRSQLN